ncbi:MAG: hypothetical protein KGD59_12505 [Candidatus Heimdallarchaeota archaeon]|nr:hypothetical protein [Candidatus Heimdallarchaeota archaeon]MBY8995365.1 hypothetical protein [Candidatus Heimdallarchaeota archaeon]
MKIRSKKLTTMTLILLVLPFVSLVSLQMKDAAAESPTLDILEVISNINYQIEVSVEITLTGFNYDLYTEFLRLYVNQSSATILANDYDSYNASKTFGRQDEATFEAQILSPVLYNGSHLDSANYNVTVVAITNTDEKSSIVEWSGGNIFIDTELPDITYIHPSVALEEVWGIYTVEVDIIDISGISLVEFFVDNNQRYQIDDPFPGQTNYKWNWNCVHDVRGVRTIKVKAKDNSSALNVDELSFSVTVVGPELSYLDPIPVTIDFNDTLKLNVTVTDDFFDIDSVYANYSIDDGPWVFSQMENLTTDQFNFTFSSYPIGTKINWELFANNTDGQYHKFLDAQYEPWEVTSVHWDHLNPTAELDYEYQLTIDQEIIVFLNVTEQSPLDICNMTYRIDEGDWQEVAMVLNETGVNNTWYEYKHHFAGGYPIFTHIQFYIWLNDSGNNILKLGNSGDFYLIKIIPHDLKAPEITIDEIPEIITTLQNITVTVTINETSALLSVDVLYRVKGRQYSIAMSQIATDTWTASFVVLATTGETVEIWVRAIDEYYNTAETDVADFVVEAAKAGVTHSNFLLWVMLIVLIILPIVITLLILRPQR